MPLKDPVKRKQYNKERYHKIKDFIDKDKKNEIRKKWRKNNPDANKKSYIQCGWRQKGIIFDKEFYENIYLKQKKCYSCDKLLVEGKSSAGKCLDHHHPSGHIRNVVCHTCNNERRKIDNLHNCVLLDLHKYFINNEIFM